MEQKERGFLLYPDYADKIKKLPLEQAGALFLAIFDYVRDGTIPELEPAADMCFAFIVSQFERDKEKYDETCRKRAVAGRKGAEATNSKRRQAAAKAANAESDGESEAAPEQPDATAEAGAPVKKAGAEKGQVRGICPHDGGGAPETRRAVRRAADRPND